MELCNKTCSHNSRGGSWKRTPFGVDSLAQHSIELQLTESKRLLDHHHHHHRSVAISYHQWCFLDGVLLKMPFHYSVSNDDLWEIWAEWLWICLFHSFWFVTTWFTWVCEQTSCIEQQRPNYWHLPRIWEYRIGMALEGGKYFTYFVHGRCYPRHSLELLNICRFLRAICSIILM